MNGRPLNAMSWQFDDRLTTWTGNQPRGLWHRRLQRSAHARTSRIQGDPWLGGQSEVRVRRPLSHANIASFNTAPITSIAASALPQRQVVNQYRWLTHKAR